MRRNLPILAGFVAAALSASSAWAAPKVVVFDAVNDAGFAPVSSLDTFGSLVHHCAPVTGNVAADEFRVTGVLSGHVELAVVQFSSTGDNFLDINWRSYSAFSGTHLSPDVVFNSQLKYFVITNQAKRLEVDLQALGLPDDLSWVKITDVTFSYADSNPATTFAAELFPQYSRSQYEKLSSPRLGFDLADTSVMSVAVPEPTTGALVLAGAALALLRRR